MTTALSEAVAELVKSEQLFSQATLSPVEYKNRREPALARAINAMAEELGVTLQAPLHPDSRGEYSIVALKADGSDPRYGCGQFGAVFAQELTRHHARCGTMPAVLDPSNGWCKLFHMEAEKMVRAYAQAHPTTA